MQGLYYKSEISHRTRKQLTAYVLKIVTKTNNLMLGRWKALTKKTSLFLLRNRWWKQNHTTYGFIRRLQPYDVWLLTSWGKRLAEYPFFFSIENTRSRTGWGNDRCLFANLLLWLKISFLYIINLTSTYLYWKFKFRWAKIWSKVLYSDSIRDSGRTIFGTSLVDS